MQSLSLMARIRHYFAAGLLVTLPVFVTVYLLFVVFRFVDGIWGKVINFYLKKNFGFSVPGLGFILGLLTIFFVGFLATNFLSRRLFQSLENRFRRFPLVKQIYPAAKQIVGSLLSREKPAFKRVVLVEYPSKGIWSIGFLTNDSFKKANTAAGADLVHVLIATTPSPFTGYLTMIPRENIRFLDITVEEGIKLVVSGGIVKP